MTAPAPAVTTPPVTVLQAPVLTEGADGTNPTSLPGKITLPTLATIAAVAAIVYFARDIVLPLAIATLISFALSPLATRLRKMGVPNLACVLIVVCMAFAGIGLFVLVVGSQLTSLAQNLPAFQANIIEKVETLRNAGDENSLVGRLGEMISAISAEVGGGAADDQTGAGAGPPTVEPMQVEMVDSQSPGGILRDVVLPLLSPIATVGLVIVVVIFMLMERDDLRDRFIRLVGSSDLHRSTQVLTEAGNRVAQYLLVQLLVNIIYAVPIGIGLFLIGVPNAVLWGLLTLVLRFVPYIGSILAAAFPLFLAFAVSPDWSAVLWTIALFATVELVTSNMIEPWLYGSRTGVSPLAIIVSAMFWTWLWGPLGLVMSTPLTVCLVVLGRHIPQFELFDILLGDEPALAPQSRLYQRLLVGDLTEAAVLAEEALETLYIAEYYRDVGIPALLIAQQDHGRGVLTLQQRTLLASGAQQMVADLSDVAAEEALEYVRDAPPDAAVEPRPARIDGTGYRVLCVGGRSDLDDAAAAMLAQVMVVDGADAVHRPHTDLTRTQLQGLTGDALDCVVLSFLDPAPSRASFLHIRRMKRAMPGLRVGVVIWAEPQPRAVQASDPSSRPIVPQVSPESLQQAREVGADFAVTSIDAARKAAFSRDAAVPLAQLARKRVPRQSYAKADAS